MRYDETVGILIALLESEGYSADKIDAIVDSYLVQMDGNTAFERQELATAFEQRAGHGAEAERFYQRIMRRP